MKKEYRNRVLVEHVPLQRINTSLTSEMQSRMSIFLLLFRCSGYANETSACIGSLNSK
jgi:hypothetical protein